MTVNEGKRPRKGACDSGDLQGCVFFWIRMTCKVHTYYLQNKTPFPFIFGSFRLEQRHKVICITL